MTSSTKEALTFLEAFLVRSNDRSMFSKAELQDLALDLHLILDPVKETADAAV